MSLPSDIKPLFANLRRIGLLDYVGSDEFDDLMIEIDLDKEWNEELKRTGEMEEEDDYSDAQYDEAFIEFLDWIYHNYDFFDFIQDLLIDYTKWSDDTFEISSIHENLKELGLKKRDLLEFQKEFRKVRDSRSASSKIRSHVDLDPKKVFVVHGHDSIALRELEKFLKDDVDMNPIILQDQLTETLETIIAKIERLAGECMYAVVLMTPDDETKDNQRRARQNVILELGYFIGRFKALGKGKVVLIKKGNIEKPSDIDGVIYYQYTNSIEEIFHRLNKQFDAWKKELDGANNP